MDDTCDNMLALIWICVICITLCFWVKHKYSYFELRGAPQIPLPLLFRSLIKVFTKQQHLTKLSTDTYNLFPNERFIGVYEVTNPAIVIRDPELLKLIGIKDFDHFANRRIFRVTEDLYVTKIMSGLQGDTWKKIRSMLSPSYTSSKLKLLTRLVEACSKAVFEDLEEKVNNSPDKYVDVDTQDLFTRYTSDVMATCAFGIEINSIKERDNKFYDMGSTIARFNLIEAFKFVILMTMPTVYKVLNMKVFDVNATQFMRNTLFSVIEDREERKNYRPDMIQLLVEVRKVFHDDYVLGQAFIFYFAGFELVSTSIKFMLYELAINNDIQEKLRQEIDEHQIKYEGKFEYESIEDLKYLQMVLSEGFRKWPAVAMSDRECTKPYNVGKARMSSDKDFIIEKDTTIIIPIFAIHRDPKHYENPEKFDPERFSKENINKIKPFTYLPFGLGPRKCIAPPFTLLQIKVLIFSIVRRFKITTSPGTIVQPRLDPKYIGLRLDGGHWLRFHPRT